MLAFDDGLGQSLPAQGGPHLPGNRLDCQSPLMFGDKLHCQKPEMFGLGQSLPAQGGPHLPGNRLDCQSPLMYGDSIHCRKPGLFGVGDLLIGENIIPAATALAAGGAAAYLLLKQAKAKKVSLIVTGVGLAGLALMHIKGIIDRN